MSDIYTEVVDSLKVLDPDGRLEKKRTWTVLVLAPHRDRASFAGGEIHLVARRQNTKLIISQYLHHHYDAELARDHFFARSSRKFLAT